MAPRILDSRQDTPSYDPASQPSSAASFSSSSIVTDPMQPGFTGWPMPHWGADAPAGANGGTDLSTGAIAGIIVGCAVALFALVAALYMFTRHKKAERRASMATLVDPEAEAEARKKDDLSRSPRTTFERMPEDDERMRDTESWTRATRTHRLGSADTYVDETAQQPIPLHDMGQDAGRASEEQVPAYAAVNPATVHIPRL